MRRVEYTCTVLLVFFVSFLLVSCIREEAVYEQDIEIALEKGEKKRSFAASESLYVSVQGDSSKRLQKLLEASLEDFGFSLSGTPGKADSIVQISVIYVGKTDRESIQNALRSGYDTKVAFHGESVGGIVVDMLIVRREVSRERSEEQSSLATISNRHALGSRTQRLAFYVPGLRIMKPVPQAFGAALAREVSKNFAQGVTREGRKNVEKGTE